MIFFSVHKSAGLTSLLKVWKQLFNIDQFIFHTFMADLPLKCLNIKDTSL